MATAAIIEAVDEGLEAPMARSIDIEMRRLPADAAQRGRRRGHPGVLRQARARVQGALTLDGSRHRRQGRARHRRRPQPRQGRRGRCWPARAARSRSWISTPRAPRRRRARSPAAGGRARGYACDIRDTAQVQDTVARIERDLGPVDICVNNAGMIYTVGQLKDMRDEDWELNLARQPDRDDARSRRRCSRACASGAGGGSSAWPRSPASWAASVRRPTRPARSG